MRSLLILVLAFTGSEATRSCPFENPWKGCNCKEILETAVSRGQPTRSETGKNTNEVTTDGLTCNSSYIIPWLHKVCDSSLEVWMSQNGYERHGNSLYKFHTVSQSWENARRACERDGAHLVIINSEYEAGVLQELFRKHPSLQNVYSNDYVFIGIHDLYNEGEFLTVLGEPIAKARYSKFAVGEPSNTGWNNEGHPGEDCGTFHREGDLNDVPCDLFHAFICELDYNFNPPRQGIDYSAGAYKGVEKVKKPPPGQVQRTDAGEGYEFFAGIGFYRFHTNADVWENARRTCEKEGAHLAIVNSESEAQVLSEMFKQRRVLENTADYKVAYIGFHDQFNEGQYVTIYGEPLTSTGYYRWWDTSVPNNFAASNVYSGEDCGGFYMDGGYDDLACNLKHVFFCEKELWQWKRK